MENKKTEQIITPDLREKPKFLFLYFKEFLIICLLIFASIILMSATKKFEPLAVAIPIIAFILLMKPGNNNQSVYSELVIMLKFVIFEQQKLEEKELKKKYTYSIKEDHVEINKHMVFFYELKTYNVELTSQIELDTAINNLASCIANADNYEIFSYDKPVNLKDNISFRKNLMSSLNTLQQKVLCLILNDYYEKEKMPQSSTKAFALKVSLTRHQYELGHLNALESSLNSIILHKMNKYQISEMLNTYLFKDYVKRDNDFVLEDNKAPKTMNFMSGYGVQDNDIYFKTISIKAFPSPLKSGLLSQIAHFENSNILIRYKKSNDDIRSMISTYANKIVYQEKQGKKIDKWEAENAEKKVISFNQEISDNSRNIIEVSVFVQLWARDLNKLNEISMELETKLTALGLKTDKQKMNQQDVYTNVCPIFLNYSNKYSYTMLNITGSALFPLNYIFKNDYKGIHMGNIVNGCDLHIDLHARNSVQLNGNTIIVGSSGSGKSTIQDNMIIQEILNNSYNFTIDPEGQKGVLFKRFDGLDFNVAEAKYCINPMEIRFTGFDDEVVDEKGNVSILEEFSQQFLNGRELIDNHVSYVLGFLRLVKPKLNDDSNDLIEMYEYYLNELYKEYGFLTNNDVLKACANDFPIFSDLYDFIEKDVVNLIDKESRKRLLLNLNTLAYGSYASVFNGHTNIEDNKNINFNIQSLLASGDRTKVNGALYNILYYVFARSIALKQPSNIWIDELYLLLNEEAIIIAYLLRDLWKRARKYNLNMIAATQNIVDLLQGRIRDITLPIFSNSNKKLIFEPGEGEEKAIQEAFHFSNYIMSRIRKLTKGQYLFIEHQNKFLVDSYDKLLPTILPIVKNETYSVVRDYKLND